VSAPLPVFYDPRQSAQAVGSFSPSAAKPAAVVASWQALGVPLDVRTFAPASREQLCRVHEPEHVDGVLAGARKNGFHNTSAEIAASLPWTSGSMIAAARHAATAGPVAASPTSGFHHAGPSSASAYCTFNGLAAAAAALLDEGLAAKVGILDLDMHYGDGTDAILLRRRLVDRVEHYTFGLSAVAHGPARDPAGTETWLRGLEAIVAAFAERGCGVLLCQLGADPHVDDPLGGVMTTEQMRRRDRTVFETCRSLGLPVAWNLAGGYQQPLRRVLDLHDATLLECAYAFGAVARPAVAGG
jgi:acetoin utilization deacetylase AcuC-like enzyme